MATAKKVITEALSHKGYKETGNNRTIFGQWYGVNGVAWCAMFVSYCMNKAGAGALIKGAATAKGTARVSDFMRHAQKHKWAKISPANAQMGDIVIFDFPGGYETDHVGFIRAASKGKNIYTIEGNTSSGTGSQSNGGGVYPRTRPFNLVHSIWRPPYDAETIQKPTVTPVEAISTPTPVTIQPEAAKAFTDLKKGSKGNAVKKVQTALKITSDGIFGAITEKTVKDYQTRKGLIVTGIVNEETWKRLGL